MKTHNSIQFGEICSSFCVPKHADFLYKLELNHFAFAREKKPIIFGILVRACFGHLKCVYIRESRIFGAPKTALG